MCKKATVWGFTRTPNGVLTVLISGYLRYNKRVVGGSRYGVEGLRAWGLGVWKFGVEGNLVLKSFGACLMSV